MIVFTELLLKQVAARVCSIFLESKPTSSLRRSLGVQPDQDNDHVSQFVRDEPEGLAKSSLLG